MKHHESKVRQKYTTPKTCREGGISYFVFPFPPAFPPVAPPGGTKFQGLVVI